MILNYAASSWKHNSKYNFGSISSEGISFIDCLQESELSFANSSSFFFLAALPSREGISCLLSTQEKHRDKQ